MSQNRRLKKVRNFFSCTNQLAFSSKMAHDIMAIREKLGAIAEDRKNFNLIERPIENTKREETQSFIHEESVIGRKGDKMTIIQFLLDNNVQETNVSVVAIVGIGGLGKTTLAQLVYNDESVTKHFEVKFWVCVSNPFDVKLIAQKIIGCGVGKDLPLEEVQNQLRTKIDGKRYLLVLDDVWNEDREMWLKLRGLLMGGSRGSKILVTTRNQLVAEVSEAANPPYHLHVLSEKESWSLFEQMAFKQGEKYENTSRVPIGKEIVEKCKGVPLAIRAIGSLLYSKSTETEWLFFKNNDLLKIAQKENVILPILKLSYNYLPLNLKRCFACCSLCQKDQEIGKQKLIQLWIAHGFIQSDYENQQLEDVGDLYFMELLRRSFFQDIKRDKWGDIESCKMHDFVYDLAQLVARHENSTLNSDRTRHESFGFRIQPSWEIPTHSVKTNKLRSFILKNQNQAQDLKEKVLKRIVSTFKFLRVLDLSKLKIKTMPSYISKLKHLRYLDLSYNRMETLPSSITKWVNLQTLKLNECYRLVELPRDTKNMVNLRHLELDKCFSLIGMPCELGQLTSLLTLTTFVADSCSRLIELQSLKHLGGRLHIRMRRHRDSCGNWCSENATEGKMVGTNYLKAKQYLKKLVLEFQWVDDEELLLESLRPHPNLKELEIYDYRGVSFPSWIMVDKIGLSFLPNLVRITMGDCRRCTHLPLFGQLPSLRFLCLSEISSVEYIDSSNGNVSGGKDSLSSSLPSSSSSGAAAIRRSESTFFPSLKELQLCCLQNLKGWWRRKAAAAEEEATTTTSSATLPDQQSLLYCLPSFASLSILTIKDCPNLASIPILQPCLEQLQLEKVSRKLVEQELMMTRVSPTPTDTVATSSSSSSFLPLSNLKYLTLRNIMDLDDDEDMQFLQGLRKLFFLSIESISELVSLPLRLQHLTTLATLQICECDNLMALPEWIGKLTSLERLNIFKCPKLTSLPDGMCPLTALQLLTITNCDEVLYDRCQKETGEDWPKIAHIPNVLISRTET